MKRWRQARRSCLLVVGFQGALLAFGCAPEGDPPPEAAIVERTPAPGLETRWAGEVDPTAPLPEYPRPQMVRPLWVNLNGLWDLAVSTGSPQVPDVFPETILVPFPVESSLGGVRLIVSPAQRVWYRRSFVLPEPSDTFPFDRGQVRWLLHFGAVDWEAEVFLNGRPVGSHRGGYDPFSFDVTEVLRERGEQELVVAVRDPTDSGDQPRGKQVLEPQGIWYNAVTGIWQTVWLEPVPETHVRRLRIVPDVRSERVEVEVAVSGRRLDSEVRVVAFQGEEEVSRVSGSPGEVLSLPIPGPRLWSPGDPFLYGLRVSLHPPGSGPDAGREGGAERDSPQERGDEVESYFGMRSIEVGPDAEGHQRLILNGEPLFQYGLLDQGWWPDGLYTAPTDDALRFDIATSRRLGFNLIRKHVKVEPARWYYHADREGVLVWQDMPSADNETPAGKDQFARELEAMVESLRNHPSIVMWVPFNEGWGQHDTERYAAWLKTRDPTRLVNPASGWTDEGGGDVLDIHRYPGPGAPDPEAIPRSASGGEASTSESEPPGFPEIRAAVLGEFGGLGLPLSSHTWVDERNWGYRTYDNQVTLNSAYQELIFQLRPLVGEGLSAAVYTQTTDVESEVNGIMTYDREVIKLTRESLSAHRYLYGPPPRLRPVLPTSREEPQVWRYTTEDPGEGWESAGLNDSSWSEGSGGFGTEGTPGARIGTRWDSREIWLRRRFELSVEDRERLDRGSIHLRVHHDEDTDIFLNGVQIAAMAGHTTGYRLYPLDQVAISLFRTGRNTLAVQARQTQGGQYIDVGIVEWIETGR